jgi:hypothetical protein
MHIFDKRSGFSGRAACRAYSGCSAGRRAAGVDRHATGGRGSAGVVAAAAVARRQGARQTCA